MDVDHLEMKAIVRLYEGSFLVKTWEDTESLTFTLPLDGETHDFKLPQVRNTGTVFKEDYADVTLSLAAKHPENEILIFPNRTCPADTAGAAPEILTTGQVIPEETALLTNYPNPFNPETWIPYQLAEPAEVTLTIYSIDGQLVRTLVLGHQAAGAYHSKARAAYWDGRNELGERVASGLYFYTLTAGDFTTTRKMLIMK